jgi:glutamate receptor, ionotropic, invertebrate
LIPKKDTNVQFWFNLGAVFNEEHKDTSVELAFKYAVYKINKDRNLLPKTTLIYDIQYISDSSDSFRSSKKVCKQIENGVTAIFGKSHRSDKNIYD